MIKNEVINKRRTYNFLSKRRKDIPNVDDSLHNLTKEDEEMIKRLTEALEKYNKDNSTSVLINTNN